jgi:FAD/FMN-containing dehydrogenase
MPTTAERPTKLQSLSDRLAGSILLPGDEGWDEHRGAFNVLVDQRPAAIALPVDADDVSLVIRFAREHGLRIAPQTTGHNAAPLGDLENTIIVRTSEMNAVEIDPQTRTARVGAGARWGEVVEQASKHGLAALHGSSPTVGVAGYTLGGGIGWYARKHGLASNSVSAIEIVIADGRRLRVDARKEADLFWALRGGGGNFGVVTALEFELYPVAQVYAGALFFPWERSAEVLKAWREWTQTVPDEVTSVGRILQVPDMDGPPPELRGRSFVVVEAACLGTEDEGRAATAALRDLGPELDTFAMSPPAALARLHMDPEEPVPAVSGHMLVGELPESAIDHLVKVAGPDSDSALISVELRHTGGALARRGSGAGALASLPGEYAMFAVGAAGDEDAVQALDSQIGLVKAVLSEWTEGSYLNFVEEPCDAATVFPPTAYGRLRAIKAAYDPGCTFRANHPIALPLAHK